MCSADILNQSTATQKIKLKQIHLQKKEEVNREKIKANREREREKIRVWESERVSSYQMVQIWGLQAVTPASRRGQAVKACALTMRPWPVRVVSVRCGAVQTVWCFFKPPVRCDTWWCDWWASGVPVKYGAQPLSHSLSLSSTLRCFFFVLLQLGLARP